MPFNSISRLPVAGRAKWLAKLSANAHAPGASKKQTKGRARQDAARNMLNTMGIYLIEVVVTGPQAASIGGAVPGATINTGGGTPATFVVPAGNPPALTPVTWASPGPKGVYMSAPPPGPHTFAEGAANFVV